MNLRLACLLLCASLPARAELVSGVVRQLHGLPAVGAVVELRPAAQTGALLSARTDSQGRFEVEAAPGTYALRVAGALDDTRHALTVLDDAGQPLLHATVRLVAQGETEPVPPECLGMARRTATDGAGTNSRRWVYERTLTSDARGRCAFDVPAGLVTLGAFSGAGRLVTGLLAQPGQELPTLTLRRPAGADAAPPATPPPMPETLAVAGPPGRLSGVLRDHQGQPWAERAVCLSVAWRVAGAAVDTWHERSWVVFTDAAGRYDLAEPDVPTGTVDVSLRAADGTSEVARRVRLAAGESTELS